MVAESLVIFCRETTQYSLLIWFVSSAYILTKAALTAFLSTIGEIGMKSEAIMVNYSLQTRAIIVFGRYLKLPATFTRLPAQALLAFKMDTALGFTHRKE